MQYLITLKNTALIVAVLLLNLVSFSVHTSAMPAMSHEMNSGMKHSSSDSASCATLCRTAVFSKEESLDSNNGEENDEPVVPFYVLTEGWHFNDSIHDMGRGLDRHAHIGEGTLGYAPFSFVLNDPLWEHTPCILETPQNASGHAGNMSILRKLRGG